MRKEQLKEAVGELNLVDTVFEADGVSYIDTAVSVMQVYDLIDQLDEPEVLSQEWIRNNQERKGVHFFVNVTKLQNLLVPKEESPVVLEHIDEFITRAISVETTARTIEMLSGMTIEQVAEGFRDGKFDPKEELIMTKLETLVVPTDLEEWLQSRRIGDSGVYFTTLDELCHYWETVAGSPTGYFIAKNKKELIEVILGSRGYRVEASLYHALIKGHEVSNSYDIYWNYDKYDDDVFVSRLYPSHDNFSTEMSKSEWNELGINDSNADFVKVEEMEE